VLNMNRVRNRVLNVLGSTFEKIYSAA